MARALARSHEAPRRGETRCERDSRIFPESVPLGGLLINSGTEILIYVAGCG